MSCSVGWDISAWNQVFDRDIPLALQKNKGGQTKNRMMTCVSDEIIVTFWLPQLLILSRRRMDPTKMQSMLLKKLSYCISVAAHWVNTNWNITIKHMHIWCFGYMDLINTCAALTTQRIFSAALCTLRTMLLILSWFHLWLIFLSFWCTTWVIAKCSSQPGWLPRQRCHFLCLFSEGKRDWQWIRSLVLFRYYTILSWSEAVLFYLLNYQKMYERVIHVSADSTISWRQECIKGV